jgi:hypothetical protein
LKHGQAKAQLAVGLPEKWQKRPAGAFAFSWKFNKTCPNNARQA